LGVSLPLFALFIFVEMKIASEPFAPGHLIFSRALFAPYLCNFFSFGGWFAGIFYIPLYYQVVDDLSATQAGALLLPAIVASVSGSLGGGISMRKTGKYYWLTLGAYSAMTLGLIPIILCSGPVTHSIVGITIGMVITGFSNGIGVTTTLIALIANTTPEEQAIATACSYLFRSLGSVTGVSLASTIVQQSLRSNLRASLKSDHDIEKIVKGVRRSLEYIKTLEPAILALVVHCYENAIVWAFVFGAVTVSGAAISAVYLVEKPLSR
jgi:predicted MFS family arabinose efflux permease